MNEREEEVGEDDLQNKHETLRVLYALFLEIRDAHALSVTIQGNVRSRAARIMTSIRLHAATAKHQGWRDTRLRTLQKAICQTSNSFSAYDRRQTRAKVSFKVLLGSTKTVSHTLYHTYVPKWIVACLKKQFTYTQEFTCCLRQRLSVISNVTPEVSCQLPTKEKKDRSDKGVRLDQQRRCASNILITRNHRWNSSLYCSLLYTCQTERPTVTTWVIWFWKSCPSITEDDPWVVIQNKRALPNLKIKVSSTLLSVCWNLILTDEIIQPTTPTFSRYSWRKRGFHGWPGRINDADAAEPDSVMGKLPQFEALNKSTSNARRCIDRTLCPLDEATV